MNNRSSFPWLQLLVAVIAMLLTIPGRTQGLGLITEPILRDPVLLLSRTEFAWLNLLATLAGATFALPAGWLMDRFGTKWIMMGILLLLGISTYYFAGAMTQGSFFAGLILMRALGQSALSAASLTHMGKWFPGKLSTGMAWFAVLTTMGFMGLFGGLEVLIDSQGWRDSWKYIAAVCIIVPVAFYLMCRNAVATTDAGSTTQDAGKRQYTWFEAICTVRFWVLACSAGLFNWVSSGIGLFNEDVLKETGFGRDLYVKAIATTAMVSLLSGGLGGWLANRWSPGRLMFLGMLMLAGCLASLPYLQSDWQVYVNAVLLGIAAGLVMVVFFACWGEFFGTLHLGKIQGTAQVITVLASALGPVSLALSKDHFSSYRPLFLLLAGLAILCGVLCLTHAKRAGSGPSL